MVRSHSLILRCAAARGCLVAGRQDAVATAEPPWLMHPVEHGTLKHFNNVSLLFSSHQLIN